MTPPLNNAYLSSHSSLEKSGVHFGNLGTFCVGSTFQNERFSKTPNTAMYTFTILHRVTPSCYTQLLLPAGQSRAGGARWKNPATPPASRRLLRPGNCTVPKHVRLR